MATAQAIARGKIIRGEATRIGEIISLRNYRDWENRMQKTPGFLKRRVEDPRRWRLVDAHLFAALIDIEPEQAEQLINAEITFFERERQR